jgi:hypothetical protein
MRISKERKEQRAKRYAATVEKAKKMRNERNLLAFVTKRVLDMNVESPSDNFDESEMDYTLLRSVNKTMRIMNFDDRFIVEMEDGAQYKITVEEL